ncbi:MAG: alkaline phosphatase D family protein [Deltaproteobacteria bacterium]|nr:alkaline phosphatase D family protein [Deltaproteobacteria bacterium]
MRVVLVVWLLGISACPRAGDPSPANPAEPPGAPAATGPQTDDDPPGVATGDPGPHTGPTGPTAPTGPFVVEDARAVDATTFAVRFSHPIAPPAATLTGVPLVALAIDAADPRVLRVRTADFAAVPAATIDLQPMTDSAGAPLTGQTKHDVTGLVVPIAASSFAGASLADVSGFAVVDDPGATNEAPSVWALTAGALRQSGNLYGGSAADRRSLDKPGTYFLSTATAPDAFVQATLQNADDDGMGLIARYTDSAHYYRFEWLAQGSIRRLVKIDGATKSVLDFDVAPFIPGQTYRVRLTAVGARLTVFIDDELVLQASDTALTQGRFGVYCWGSQGLVVDDLVVAPAALATYPEADPRLHSAAPIFTHAPMVSEMDQTSAAIWARTSEPADVRALVSLSPKMTAPVASNLITTAAASDRTAHLSIAGLQAGTRYYLQVEARDKARSSERNLSPVRAFTTAAASGPLDLSFTWFGDVHDGAEARFVGFDSMKAAAPDFALALGDFPYADSDPVATTLADYRTKHAVVRSIPALDGFIGRFPIYGTWDDHEIANDWDGATSASRVQNGIAAWNEWWPVKPHTSAPAKAIYRSFRYGSTLEIFLLDTRSQRPANSVTDNAAKTMLGAAQKQWLLAALQASTARFKIIVTSIPLRYGTTGSDHWPGYTFERKQIFDALAGKSGVFFITADQHWHAAHAHPEGFPEFQASSLSAGLRAPLSPRPAEVIFQSMVHGYGRVEIKGTGADPRAIVSLHDLSGAVLYTQTIR